MDELHFGDLLADDYWIVMYICASPGDEFGTGTFWGLVLGYDGASDILRTIQPFSRYDWLTVNGHTVSTERSE